MRSKKVLLLPIALWLAMLPAAAIDIWVDDDNCPGPGTGTQGDPFCSIQDAYTNALDLDVIRVLPGNYNECVLAAGLIEDKRVDLIADDFENGSGLNTTTTIDGTTTCGPASGFPSSTVIIGSSNSEIKGFTVRGAALTGIFGFGGVAITSNLVTNNTSTFGGGIYVYSAACYYGDTLSTVANNTVENNTATFDAGQQQGGDGGGVYIFAVGTDAGGAGGCLAGDPAVTVQGNTIQNNSVNGDVGGSNTPFGGGLVVFTNSSAPRGATVTVTSNVITGNSMTAGSVGYGGGAWITTYGYGTEAIFVDGNTIANNSSTGDGGGVSAWIQTLNLADHTLTLDTNTITGNTADGNGGGADLFLFADDLAASESVSLTAVDNIVTGNSAAGFVGGGGGMLATFFSQRTVAPNMEFALTGNRVTSNSSEVSGGGVSLFVSADSDPEFDIGGPILPAVAQVDVENNLIADNTAGGGAGGAVGGGVFAYLQSFGDGTATAQLNLNTIAGNSTEAGAGGIEVEQLAEFDTPGVNEGLNELFINSSIISENTGWGIGGPAAGNPGVLTSGAGSFNLTFAVDFSDIFNNGNGAVEGSLPQGGLSFITEDPLLDVARLPGTCSPTIDAADPGFAVGAEPAPNGGRANMGHTGGTANATTSLNDPSGDGVVDGVDVVRIGISFGAAALDPRFDAAADIDGNGMVDGNDLALVSAQYGSCL